MARERMVTRSVFVGVYDVMTVNMNTLQVETLKVEIASANSMKEKQLKDAIENAVPEGYKYVTHSASESKEVLYGMPEADFIRLAKVLPSR